MKDVIVIATVKFSKCFHGISVVYIVAYGMVTFSNMKNEIPFTGIEVACLTQVIEEKTIEMKLGNFKGVLIYCSPLLC